MEPAEFIIKIIIIGTLAVGILGFILQSASFEGRVLSYDKERLAIDLAHGMASAPCLVHKENGEARKGLLDAARLDEQAGSPDFCVSAAVRWGAQVTAGERSWGFGPAGGAAGPAPEGAVSKSVPVAVLGSDGSAVPGTIKVVVE